MGPEVEAFEKEWAEYCGAKYCVGVSSGTDALYLALKAVAKNQEVLTTPATFFATVQAIIQSENQPTFVDIGDDYNIDVGEGARSKAYIRLPVHLYGRPVEIPDPNPYLVIEDSAQAHGLPLRGKMACFSFYPTKNLGAMGQAGAVVTNDVDLANAVREMRTYCERGRFVHYGTTGNFRMDELQAAILRAKLPHLDGWNKSRRDIAGIYRDYLERLEGVVLPRDHPEHSYHIYAIRVKERDDLAKHLERYGIQTSIRYPVPMHLQPTLKYLGYHKGDFPVAEEWAKTNLSLPMYPELTEKQVEYVAIKIRLWVNSKENW